MNTNLCAPLAILLVTATSAPAGPPAFEPVAAIVKEQCVDCHSSKTAEGGINLERFETYDSTVQDRATWKRVFDAVEAGQMPLRDSGYHLTALQRASLLRFVSELQAQPDPELRAIDPGKPVLRRLTRLEYNNTVRDLFGLKIDIFMFPERLPIADKRYFLDTRDEGLGLAVQTSLREYGQKSDVLLPQHGLPGDNRAEYGYANRGDALNFSPLMFEKYLELAHAVSHSERLERDSPVMAGLLGRTWKPSSGLEPHTNLYRDAVAAAPKYAAKENIGGQAEGNDTWRAAFEGALTEAFEYGSGGTYDVPPAHSNQTIAGKGGLIRVGFGGAILTINPNIDLWLAAFATAEETSGDRLLTNKIKGEKTFELTFKVEDEVDDVGVEQLGVCVLARKNQHGTVTLTAVLADGHETLRQAKIDPELGNVFYSFVAPPETVIRKLRVDGSRFSGDYVLLDDLGFILRGVKGDRELPADTDGTTPTQAETTSQLPVGAIDPALPLPERMKLFLRRAYRRDVSNSELMQTLRMVQQSIAGGKSEADAIRLAVQSTLVSPDFLFLGEPASPQAATVRPLSSAELASRLSYFLWASMPDDELLRVARAGELTKPEMLKQQLARMVRERSKSRELSESFAVQWLKLDQLYSSKPDRTLFREFYAGPQGKATMHGAMLTEPLLLFETVLAEDRSVLDLCDPDFTWLNEPLAALYGLQNAFRQAKKSLGEAGGAADEKAADKSWLRVALPDRNRGGVMTMAGPLMLTSLPMRTSPVKRGAWLLETIFNRPPSEPKVAFVLEESAAGAEDDLSQLSVRQRFEKHRSDPNCYSCHSRIDPPGFALETFDAIGKLRTHDGPQPVDATGAWNNVLFSGPAEFKAALRQSEREFIRGFVEHMLSYSLGRPVEHFDMPTVNQIVDDAAQAGFRLSRILEGIVLSYPFRHIRNVQGEGQ